MTLPAKIRKRLGLSEGNLILVEEKDGWIILKPLLDPSQAWFWTEEWQEGERRAEADIREGRVREAESYEEMIRKLNEG